MTSRKDLSPYPDSFKALQEFYPLIFPVLLDQDRENKQKEFDNPDNLHLLTLRSFNDSSKIIEKVLYSIHTG